MNPSSTFNRERMLMAFFAGFLFFLSLLVAPLTPSAMAEDDAPPAESEEVMETNQDEQQCLEDLSKKEMNICMCGQGTGLKFDPDSGECIAKKSRLCEAGYVFTNEDGCLPESEVICSNGISGKGKCRLRVALVCHHSNALIPGDFFKVRYNSKKLNQYLENPLDRVALTPDQVDAVSLYCQSPLETCPDSDFLIDGICIEKEEHCKSLERVYEPATDECVEQLMEENDNEEENEDDTPPSDEEEETGTEEENQDAENEEEAEEDLDDSSESDDAEETDESNEDEASDASNDSETEEGQNEDQADEATSEGASSEEDNSNHSHTQSQSIVRGAVSSNTVRSSGGGSSYQLPKAYMYREAVEHDADQVATLSEVDQNNALNPAADEEEEVEPDEAPTCDPSSQDFIITGDDAAFTCFVNRVIDGHMNDHQKAHISMPDDVSGEEVRQYLTAASHFVKMFLKTTLESEAPEWLENKNETADAYVEAAFEKGLLDENNFPFESEGDILSVAEGQRLANTLAKNLNEHSAPTNITQNTIVFESEKLKSAPLTREEALKNLFYLSTNSDIGTQE